MGSIRGAVSGGAGGREVSGERGKRLAGAAGGASGVAPVARGVARLTFPLISIQLADLKQKTSKNAVSFLLKHLAPARWSWPENDSAEAKQRQS